MIFNKHSLQWITTLYITCSALKGSTTAEEEDSTMTKMCLFYPNPSGHARSDPILSTVCAADHVHTVSKSYQKASGKCNSITF